MILQVITPIEETFELKVSIPKNYLGKQVHCLFYIEEEATSSSVKPSAQQKLSEKYRGVFTKEDAQDFEEHTKMMRNEWNNRVLIY